MSALEEFWASLAAEDTCPRCGGELDTGWECNECDYDARWLIEGLDSERAE
jgi:methionyl-tRNA synthetase